MRNDLAESAIGYSGLVQPLKGQVPIGFAAAVGSNYRFEVSVAPENYEIGSPVSLVGSLSDRRWPSADCKVQVEITYPNGVVQNLKLFDNASGIDAMAGDAIWSRRLSNTSLPGVYRFLFRAEGKNLRGELAPREATRYLTLTDPKKRPDENCPPNPDDLCGELKRRVQALDDALTQAMNDKDEARIKAIHDSIQKLLERQDNCRVLAEELQGTYEILVDAWFQEDRGSIAEQQIILSELLRHEPTSKDCTPSRSGTCDDTRRILVRSTRSLVETMDLQRDLNSGQILDRIKRIIASNPGCEVFGVDLLTFYEEMLLAYTTGDQQRSDALLAQIYKALSR